MKQPIIQQTKIDLRSCHICKTNNCLNFDKKWFCQNCEYVINE